MNIKNKKAFTMIELVFVIVVLGILAAVAVPKFAATRTDAQISKARSDVSTIRAAIINERQSRLFRGDSRFITLLDSTANNAVGTALFTGLAPNVMVNTNGAVLTLLQYGVTSSAANGKWIKTGLTQYTFNLTTGGFGNAVFNYCPIVGPGCPLAGTFDCAGAGAAAITCAALTD